MQDLDIFLAGRIVPLLCLAFLAVAFVQSSLDKILDWQGNLSWLKEHFGQTPFKNVVPIMLAKLTALELASGVLCFAGALFLLIDFQSRLGFYGAVLSAVTFLMLFAGQRIARDYQGAAVLVGYFLIAVIAVQLLK